MTGRANKWCTRVRSHLFKSAILGLCISFSAEAAELNKHASPNGGPDIIFVSGNLTIGDEKKFINVALNSEDAIVLFQSPGGNLVAGIEIGKAIHLKGFATFVPDAVQCASACALAWLGGRVRYMSNTAQVGFHAAYIDNGGQAAVSSAGNALVGAYLSQLNLPSSAIIYITEARPEGMQWLNFIDAQHYGIDVHPLDLRSTQEASAPARPTQEASAPNPSLAAQISSVRKEVYDLVSATNRANDASLSYLNGKYRDQVQYYGKVLAKQTVLNDKAAFFEKWPVRNYSVRAGSVTVTCKTVSECRADGVLDWEVSGHILSSKGSGTFSFVWYLEGGDWKIASETNRPLDRKSIDAPAASVSRP
jgi:hypothetical protein